MRLLLLLIAILLVGCDIQVKGTRLELQVIVDDNVASRVIIDNPEFIIPIEGIQMRPPDREQVASEIIY